MNEPNDIEFNIYNPVITYEHRAAYDMILGQLQGIFPICNQGKCKALEVTDDPQKQKQINDLMEKVEYFSESLIGITKVFFDQLYRAKQTSAQSISQSMAKIKIDMMERNLLERTCDVRWWAMEQAFWRCLNEGNSDANHGNKSAAKNTEADLQAAVAFACTRLEDIRNSYTLYQDLVIVNAKGIVVASANTDRRAEVIGQDVSHEAWFQRALKTQDANDYVAQDVMDSVLSQQQSLIYATAIRQHGEDTGHVVGVLGVLFDFQGECGIILGDYMPKGDHGETLDGWFSFFTNQEDKVICSSDQHFLPFGVLPGLPKSHRSQLRPGESVVSTAIFAGNRSLLVSHKSAGFADYPGLNWTSHLVLPLAAMFERSSLHGDHGLTPRELMNSCLIPENNRQTYQEIQRNKGDIQLISINGIVLATDLGKSGKSFMPIFDQITATGSSTTGKMELLLAEMSSDMLQQNLAALENLSTQAIELIDRNLFERAADVRWWATDHVFWNALSQKQGQKPDEVCRRLSIINGAYSMYRDLVLADANGKIVANSRADSRERLEGKSVSDHPWFRQGMQLNRSAQYGAQDVGRSDLELEDTSLIFYAPVLEGGQRTGKPIGVLSILFDWKQQASPILQDCLPRMDAAVVDGGAAFYVNRDKVVIASTNEDQFPVGKSVPLPAENSSLKDGQSASGVFSVDGRKYILGSSASHGYREYKGLGWTAHVVRSID